MIRRTITRACLVSLLSVAPACQVSALQSGLTNDGSSAEAARKMPEAAALTLARSILEPLPARRNDRSAPAKAGKRNRTNLDSNSISAAASRSVFAELDSLVAAHEQGAVEEANGKSGDSTTADYRAATEGAMKGQIGQTSAQLPTKNTDETLSPAAAETAIFVHPPKTRPSAPNRHYFQIENTSHKHAKNVAVELVVPSHVHIVEVAPYDTVVVGKTARYKFASIRSGESKVIELTTNPDVKDEVVFESRFSMEHVRRLAARSAPQKVEVWSPEAIQDAEPELPQDAQPAETNKTERKKTPVRTIATKPETNVLSGRSARKEWEQQARLNYGPTGIPGKVMVANPQADQAQPPQSKEMEIEQPEVATSVPSAQPQEVALEQPEAVVEEIVESQPKVASEDLSPEVATASTKPDNGWFQSQLKTKIDGPQHAVTGEEAEYHVLVENASNKDVDDVLVQLAIPTGLEVTILDRDAWFDGKARTITWKLPKVPAGTKETIRYLAKVVSADGHLQKVTLGAANQFRGQAIFQSTVMDQYELAAPLLPFEKDNGSLK